VKEEAGGAVRGVKKRKTKPMVGIVMGSDTDFPVMVEAGRFLERFGIPYEVEVISAHRSPLRLHEYATKASGRGLKVVIVGAGGSAHLAGVVAALTILPVVAVPMATTVLAGIDSLLSCVQMPAGVPVASMAIDRPGARNAGIFAAEIIATFDRRVAARLALYKRELARSVDEKSAKVKQQLASPGS
jgi:5-(carboxyamino)imidazole ribonucleotide mutase